MTFRWEEELRDSFLEHATPSLWCDAKKVERVRSVKESTCSDGRADWVWANISASPLELLDGPTSELLEQPTCSRILAALRSASSMPVDTLRKYSGVTNGTFRRHLDALIDLHLIRSGPAQEFRLGPAFKLPKMEICSFEFKLENWRRAFQQARRYRSFSHRVYVVMPAQSAARANLHAESFQTFNIGLIAHSPDGTSKRLIRSRKMQPASPTNFLQAVGQLLGQEGAKPARRANSVKARPQLGKCPGPLNPLSSTPSLARLA